MTASPAIDNGPAVFFGAFDPTDWQQSINGLAAYQAIDQLTGQPMSATHPQQSMAIGRNPDGSLKYQRLYTPRLDADHAAGRVPILSLALFDLKAIMDPITNNESVLAGKHDAWLDQFAQDCAAVPYEFWIRLNAEMNGWWAGSYSEFDQAGNLANGNTFGSYARAWSYVVRRIRPVAPNVKWFWCSNYVQPANAKTPNSAPIGGQPTAANMLIHFMPPLQDVDAVGIDVYNKAAAVNSSWTMFTQCMEGDGKSFGNSVATLLAAAPGKPWMLGEVGCHDAPGDKAAWVTDMLKVIPTRYPFIRGLLWWNWNSGGNYSITTGPVAQAFGAGLADPHWLKAGGFPLDAGPFNLAETPDKDAQLAAGQAQVSALQQANAALIDQYAQAQSDLAATQLAASTCIERAVAAEAANAQLKANLKALADFAGS